MIYQLSNSGLGWLGAAMALAVLLSSIGYRGDPVVRWTEDVTVAGGRVITVRRIQAPLADQSDAASPKGARSALKFEHPDSRALVRWASRGFLKPAALLIESNAAWLYATPGSSQGYQAAGCPNPPTVLFRHDGHRWQQVPLTESPSAHVVGNLIMNPMDRLDRIEGAGYHLNVQRTFDEARDSRGHESLIDIAGASTQRYDCAEHKVDLLAGMASDSD